jgi:hypothetical protein
LQYNRRQHGWLYLLRSRFLLRRQQREHFLLGA